MEQELRLLRQASEKIPRIRLLAGIKIVAIALMLVLTAVPADLSASDGTQPEHPPRLDSRLAQVLEAFERGGVEEAASAAQRFDIDVNADRLRLIVEAAPARSEQAAAVASGLGAVVEASHHDLVQVLVPLPALEGLSRSGAVEFVRPPLIAVPLATSEGVALTNADDWHTQGLTGAGVKVGILDLGFQGYTDLLGTELPATVITYSARQDGDITGGGIEHGTGVAEIVHDMTPSAQLYFTNFDTEVELANASQWLTAQGVHVINASWGYFTSGPGDGSGIVDDVVTQSTAAGAMWAVAAGNHATKHWSGQFRDTNNNLFHEFANSPFDEGNQLSGFFGSLFAGESVAGELKWDDPFGAACRDYDLYLKRTDDDTGEPITVASSENRQYDGGCVPGADPIEMIQTTVPVTDIYHLVIQKHFAPVDANLDLYSGYHDIEYVVTANSVLQPADNPNALTVGAVYWSSPNAIETFSSQGPTSDGRIKPDVVGPDGVSTVTYGPAGFFGGFFGTSAAAPHLTGAAALARQRLPCYTPPQLKALLEASVVDLGAAGKDTAFGSGRLSLGAASVDTDADGTANACDADDDNDTWSDVSEGFIGTDPLDNCADVASDSAWPPDIDNDTFVDTADIAYLSSSFGLSVPSQVPARYDVAEPPSGFVDTGDIARLTAIFGEGCPP